MPAVTLGLSEVEERLRVLRRRLNSAAAQHGAYLGGSVLILGAAALVVLGLRGSLEVFRVVTWSAVVLLIGVAAAYVWWLRRRWVSLPATARLADRRAELGDRLATVLDLRARPRPSRLAPLLVAQALALGSRWQPQRIAPRRVPRSIFVFLASLLALPSTLLVSPLDPPVESVNAAAASAAAASAPASVPAVSGGAAGHHGRGYDGTGDEWAPADGEVRAEPARSQTSWSGLRPGGSRAGRGDGMIAALPEQLRQAIRHAFHAEAAGPANDLGSPRSGARGAAARRAAEDARPGEKSSGAHPKAPPPEGAGRRPQQGAALKGGQQGGQPHSAGARQDPSGAAPAAGTGASPGHLLGPKEDRAALAGAAPRTFKLTLTSFLDAIEQKGTLQRQQPRGGAPAVSGSIRRETVGGISERQLHDEPLRKAEIPPEHEDLVRRIYSWPIQ